MAKKKLKTAISIDPDLWKRLERVAAAAKRSRSAMVEQLLADALDDAEVAVKAFTDPVILEAFGQVFSDRQVLKAMASAVKDEMGDGQLDLFVKGLQGLAAEAGTGARADRREHRATGTARKPERKGGRHVSRGKR